MNETLNPERESLIDFAKWLSNQAEIDVMVVDEAVDMYLSARKENELPKCIVCGRERTLGGVGSEHPMDAYDYNPLQVVTNSSLGWYSGDDGEMCPEDITKTLRGER